ncbi:Reverse transcriptase domain, partial [Trinorchestia longiramus]
NPQVVSNIIRKLKNSAATGPDSISHHHLRHLGQHGIKILTNILNHSYSFCIFPSLWKIGKIIALPKANKSPTDKALYRPITLLCTLSKVVERLILNVTTPHVPLSPTQHGYRPHHSTTTLHTKIAQSMQDNINSRKPAKRTLLLTIDISKPFDAIP